MLVKNRIFAKNGRVLHLIPLFAFLLGSSLIAEESKLPDEGEGYAHVERFIRTLEEVRANHPDGDKLSYERLVNHALEGMLDSLDPFSAFYHPETVAAFDPDAPASEPQFTVKSLGVTLAKRDGELYFSRVRANSPAALAGFINDDRLLKLGTEEIANKDLPEAYAKLQGPAGSSLEMTVYRKSSRREITHEVTHAVVKEPAVADAFLLPQVPGAKVGYIRLSEFTATSAQEMEAALDDLEDAGMESLVLDFRGNPGGLLDASVLIAGFFLPPGTEVVSTQGRSPNAQTPALKTPERQRVKREYPLVVLIDRNSASASELVSGALQDLGRATIVGEQSFGKGSVQNIEGRAGGTALRLTFATYHTPSGKTPHEVGITPDKVVEMSEEDLANFERFKARKDASPKILAELSEWKDPALAEALQLLTTK